MAEWIEVHMTGADELDLHLMRMEEVGNRKLRGILEGLGNYAQHWMRIYVPRARGYTARHVDQTTARWRPGGAGGGGSWEVVAGVRRGDSKHPLYVHGGTGIYSFRRNTIKPIHGAWLKWYRGGRWHRAREVRGQRAQPFVYMAYQQTRLYANARILSLGHELTRRNV